MLYEANNRAVYTDKGVYIAEATEGAAEYFLPKLKPIEFLLTRECLEDLALPRLATVLIGVGSLKPYPKVAIAMGNRDTIDGDLYVSSSAGYELRYVTRMAPSFSGLGALTKLLRLSWFMESPEELLELAKEVRTLSLISRNGLHRNQEGATMYKRFKLAYDKHKEI